MIASVQVRTAIASASTATSHEQGLAVNPIAQHTAQRRQEDHRDRVTAEDEREVQRRPGEVVRQEAEPDALHLKAQAGDAKADPEPAKVPIAE